MKTTPLYYALGRPFSPIYSLAMRMRERMYNKGLLASYGLGVPVVSVGNLTLGGSGKTPMVQYLARALQCCGYHPAIISRGHGGTANGKINLVSDGTTVLLNARQAGDEPRLLAETLPGVPVLTGIVRRFPAQRAIDLGADILLLDDGFQHLQIRREVNLVLFNTDRLAGNSRVFPGGDLREPVAALKRATAFVLTDVREENRERAARFAELLQARFPGIPVFQVGYDVDGAVRLNDRGMLEPVATDLRQGKWFAFAGIAHPRAFQHTLEGFGVTLSGFQGLEDHQLYTPELLQKLVTRAVKSEGCGLLTTEKDLVKLEQVGAVTDLPLYALRMEVQAEEQFLQSILAGFAPQTNGDGEEKCPTV
nr:tetraacyldisaccharide 4'-kinase [uncultured Desulfobulbus sp.]